MTRSALLALALLALMFGHVAGAWRIPTIDEPASISGRTLDAHSITVAYSRVLTDGVSPWSVEDTERIMARFVERWSRATRARSRLQVLEETELRDVLVVFNNLRVITPTAARSIQFAGGRIHYIEVFPPPSGPLSPLLGLLAPSPSVDVEYTVGSLLHELGHQLGCCRGVGTSGGHFVGPNCQRIMCSPHGAADTFSDDELRQMGLGG